MASLSHASPDKPTSREPALKTLDANTRLSDPASSPIAQGNVYPTASRLSKAANDASRGAGAKHYGPFDASPAFAPDTPPTSSPSLFARRSLLSASSPPTEVGGSSPTKPATRPAVSRVSDASRVSSASSKDNKLDEKAGLYEMRALELEEERGRVVATPQAAEGKEVTPVTHFLLGSYTHSLVLGRGKPSGLPHAAVAAASANEMGEAAATSGVMTGLGARRTQAVILPNEARHVSRAHAVVEWIPIGRGGGNETDPNASEGTFVVRILGQNGLIVDGRRRREGHVIRLTAGKSIIDFFGLAARFDVKGDPPATLGSTSNRVVVPARLALAQKPLASLKARHQDGSSPLKVAIEARQKVRLQRKGSNLVEEGQGHGSSSPTVHLSSDIVKGRSSSPPSAAPKATGRARARKDSEEMEVDQPSSPTPAARSSQQVVALGKRTERNIAESESDEDEQIRPSKKKQAASQKPTCARRPSSSGEEDSELSSSPCESSPVRSMPAASKAVNPAPKSKIARDSMPPPAGMPRRNAMMSREGPSHSPAPPSADAEQTAALRSLACSCVEKLKDTYDLQSLLAGAIVFHRTATISATEAVRSILTSSSGMMRGEAGDHASSTELVRGQVVPGWGGRSVDPDLPADRWASVARRAWREELEAVLQNTDMFGVIQRKGRDAGGMPLECWYYYDHTLDTDVTRSANLGALAKPIRGALKTQKAVVWQRRAYGSSDWEGEGSQSMLPSLSASATSSLALVPPSPITAQLQQLAAKKLTNAPPGYDAAVWLETQVEEERETSWDRIGDQDYEAAGGKRRR